jgi:hypothetical protein
LRELLDGVTPEHATAKPVFGAHTIWELVHHVHAWQQEALLTLEGKAYDSLTGDADWPPVRETTADAWRRTLDRLQSTTRELVAAIREMNDAKLNELVGAREFSYYFVLHGVVQHNLYHAGQIALLKKALVTT